MSVLLETSVGDLVVDLYSDECPHTAANFIKLCKLKRLNNVLFHRVQTDFSVESGLVDGAGPVGRSVFGELLHPVQDGLFKAELVPSLKHDRRGTVSMTATPGKLCGSAFFITTGSRPLTHLDGVHPVFGRVAEGFDTLDKINTVFVDEDARPLKNVRIRHTIVLHDPFPDPPGLVEPSQSPVPTSDKFDADRLADDEEEAAPDTRTQEEIERDLRDAEARSKAQVLEMIGDLPDADARPPENVLFVCKLNPVTTGDDLELIFSRFGKIVKCDIIKDSKTGESLCYGFVEFEDREACERAYRKMDGVLIDERRIKVDFSQSVARLWSSYRSGRPGVQSYRQQRPHGAQQQRHHPTQRLVVGSASGPAGNNDHDLVFDHSDVGRGQVSAPSAGTGRDRPRSSSHGRSRSRSPRSPRSPSPARRAHDGARKKMKKEKRHSERKRSRSRSRSSAATSSSSSTSSSRSGGHGKKDRSNRSRHHHQDKHRGHHSHRHRRGEEDSRREAGRVHGRASRRSRSRSPERRRHK